MIIQGGSVIRMMANYLGVSTFNKGISKYLHDNSFSNAAQDDLWAFLTAAGVEDGTLTEVTVKQVMTTWTEQMGYPVIHMTRNYDGSSTASARQERFLLNPTDSLNSTDEHDYKW